MNSIIGNKAIINGRLLCAAKGNSAHWTWKPLTLPLKAFVPSTFAKDAAFSMQSESHNPTASYSSIPSPFTTTSESAELLIDWINVVNNYLGSCFYDLPTWLIVAILGLSLIELFAYEI